MTRPVARAARRAASVAWLAAMTPLAFSGSAAAQSTAVGARGALVDVRLEPETVTVGQPFVVRIRVRAPKGATVRFPPLPDSADALEPVDPRSVVASEETEILDRTAIYRLVAWDVGVRTPAFRPVTVAALGSEQRFTVSAPSVIVRSLLPVDSAEHVPKPSLDPLPLPTGRWRLWLLLSVFAAGVVWYWLRRRATAAARPPERDAFEEAATALAAIDALALPEAGEPARHVTASVDAMKAYLVRRLPGVRASFTARELVGALEGAGLPGVPERVGSLLEREESVRYANAAVDAADARVLAREAQRIVRDVQSAYDARARAADRGAPRGRRP